MRLKKSAYNSKTKNLNNIDIVRNEIRDLKRIISEKDKAIAAVRAERKALEAESKALDDAIAQKEYELAQKEYELAQKEYELQKAYAKIAELKAELELI